MSTVSLLEFNEVFPKLATPFSYAAPKTEGGEKKKPTLTTGTVIEPREDHLLLTVYAEGAVTATYTTKLPTLAEVTSGFSVGDFAAKLDSYKTTFASACPNFGNMTHEVGEYGEHFQTSTNIKVISCGQASGYFDLVVTASDGTDGAVSAVYYSSRSSTEWSHSGDSSSNGNLVHTATFKLHGDAVALPRGLLGHCTIVGFQNKALHTWYGKSTGLFVIDEAAQTTRFVPLDLSETTVVKNTVIVPLMYQASTDAEGTACLDWWIPQTMTTGMGSTETVHKELVSTLHKNFMAPAAVEPRPVLTESDDVPASADDETIQDPTATSAEDTTLGVSSVFASTAPLQIVCDANHLPSSPRKLNTLYWGRGLSTTDKNGAVTKAAERVVLPMVLPGEQVMCKAALLYTGGADMLTPDQVFSTLKSRRLILHIDGAQNVDSSFLGARKALTDDTHHDPASITRLNSVFIVHVTAKEVMNQANLALLSMYAGPKATVVFQTQDDKKYFSYWATPNSVIPCPMSADVNAEWTDFEELLENYLVCATGEAEHDHQLVAVPSNAENFATFPIALGPMVGDGKQTVTFDTLAEVLEQHRDDDYETKYSIVCHLFAWEFVLGKEQMESVKKAVRSTFKSALSSKEKVAFFENIKNLTKEDREKIKSSAKLIDRLANRLCCRKFVAVNEFLAQFQEKLAGHGQKGAQKMELGMQCAKFVESGDPAELFETERDFMLVAIDNALITNAVIAAADTSKNQDLRHLTTDGDAELVRLAALDPRTPELDGCTVDSLLALGMPHTLESKGAMQFAVPIQDGDCEGDEFSTKSLVFLPIFDQKVPDLNEFDVTIWAYVLVEGVKNSCLVPRDMKTQPRQIEYAVLKLLASFMKTLCEQRTTPVSLKTHDVNDSLVKKIRSVYWLMRAVMFKNVGVMTPEPITTLLTDGKANHVIEIEIALQILPLVNKTGLPLELLEGLVPRVTEVFCRALYTPLEKVFKKLMDAFKLIQQDEHKAVNNFRKNAAVADSSEVKAKIRSRKCSVCAELKAVHYFPRKKQLIEDASVQPEGYAYVVHEMAGTRKCLKCHGYAEENIIYVCPCKHCNKSKRGKVFAFTTRDGFATHHDCMKVPTGLSRRVPLKYCTEVGLPEPTEALSESAAEETKLKISCVAGGPLTMVQKGVPYYDPATLGALAISTTETMTYDQFVLLATKLGLLSPTTYSRQMQDASANSRTATAVVPTKEDLAQLQQEVGGILTLMINSFRSVPAWKEVVGPVIKGDHKEGKPVLLSLFEVTAKEEKVDEKADAKLKTKKERILEGKKKNAEWMEANGKKE